MSYLTTHLGEIGTLTLQHVALVFSALAIALAIALPLGIAAARWRRFSSAILALLGILYAIPSLALLAVLVRYIGLGAAPVVIVLAIYAQFILVRNIAAALAGVSPAQIDAAVGVGMSSRQRLWRVELPLAFPVILGGVRLATVALIAIATLGGYVGAGGLGADIFFGLQRRYVEQTLAGSIPAALLAIAADALFRALERLAVRRTTG
ncbi:MAG TPA: ABC transporter permease [Candidatus Rubrimentiphilum sp.]|nr:ABC transporter permease [Candidatus Rubrimentiphilum sp.]